MQQIWFLLPLIVSISLVYGATRHERMKEILEHSLRTGVWMLGFMFSVFLVLFAFDWWFN